MSSFVIKINKCECDNCGKLGERVLSHHEGADDLPSNWRLISLHLTTFTDTGNVSRLIEKTFCSVTCLKDFLANKMGYN